MPDDPLAPAAAPEAPVPEPTPDNGNGTPAPAAAPEGMTAEALTAAVQEAIRPFESRVEALQQENERLRAEQTPTPLPADPPEDEADFFSRFTNDPEGAIKGLVQGEQKQLAPLLATMLNTQHENLVLNQRMQADARYGDGAWDEVFAPVLKEVFANARKQDPTMLANPEYIQGEVLKLRGFHEEKLLERRTKAREAAETQRKTGMDEISRHLLNSTNLSGGIRPASAERDLSAEEKEYVALRAQHGKQVDEKALQRNLQLSGRGVNFDDWKKLQPPQKGA